MTGTVIIMRGVRAREEQTGATIAAVSVQGVMLPQAVHDVFFAEAVACGSSVEEIIAERLMEIAARKLRRERGEQT
ncbi:MAG: hypothetical protein WC026_16875 [Hyphomicrobium sp.]|uniref:hypothetical protein n=1 Tax=Hyphomicrobium sp. TaxID=82 RepID=UPI00356192F3